MINTERDELLLALRPVLPENLINAHTADSELFQNKTLRPIIKFQHHLIIQLIKNFISSTNSKFFEENAEKREAYIRTSLTKNGSLKKQYVGLILGLMTHSETLEFLENSSEYSKRIIQIIANRIIASMTDIEA